MLRERMCTSRSMILKRKLKEDLMNIFSERKDRIIQDSEAP
jgi:hypothetical protein